MNNLFPILFSIVVTLSFSDKGFCISTLTLSAGQTSTISSNGNENLTLSRKGIVDLIFLSPGKWQITALKKGLVIIKGDYSSTSKTNKTYYKVHVSPRLKSETVYKMKNKAFPLELCAKPQITCNGNRIEGTLHRKPEFDFIKEHCTLERNCINETKLGKEIQIAANIVMQTSNSNQEYGINSISALINSNKLNFIDLNKEITNKFSTGEIKIIGDPIIRLLPNKSAVISTGGEMQPIGHTNGTENAQTWKTYGLIIKLNFMPTSTSSGNLTFDFELKVPTSGNSLDSNSINSSITLIKGVPKIAGQVYLTKKGSSSQNQSFLSRIPIIAPLFQSNNEASTKQKIVLILTWVDEDSSPYHRSSSGSDAGSK